MTVKVRMLRDFNAYWHAGRVDNMEAGLADTLAARGMLAIERCPGTVTVPREAVPKIRRRSKRGKR